MLRWPLEARRAFLERVGKVRGQEARESLEAELMRAWAGRKIDSIIPIGDKSERESKS